jgi:hypothetical protein
MNTKTKVPLPVLVLGFFVFLAGIYISYTVVTNPSAVVTGFTVDDASDRVIQVMLAGRIVAMVIVLGVALALRSPLLLAFVFLMRVIVEIFDLVASVGYGGFTGQAVAVVIFAFAVLETAALVWLIARIRAGGASGRVHAAKMTS